MKNVYLISGLGATKHSFDFLDLSFCKPVFLDWVTPEKGDSLRSYAARLRTKITEPNPVIIGLSFGGMLASEMAQADPGTKVILISSNKTSAEFPPYLRLGNYLPAYKWVPDGLIRKAGWILKYFFSASGKAQQQVQLSILKQTDMRFTKAAIEMILRWKSGNAPANVVHIHGTADRLLPYKLVKADYTIQGGTHLMIMDKGDEISLILRQLILPADQ